MTIPEKLLPFLEKPKRFKIAYGGRGGAKSQTFADMLLMKAQVEQAKVGCFREMQNSIEDSVHSLLKEEIDRLTLQGFVVQKADIEHQDGGIFKFKGLARNPDAIKSMHGFKYFWVEEAHAISKDSLEKLTPTTRIEGSEIWFSLNPQSSEDPMSQRFLVPYWDELEKNGYYEDDLHLIIKINWRDNPWFPEVLNQERLWDFEHKSRAEYDHIWEGHFNDQVDNSIILPEWFDAAVDAHKKIGFKPRGLKVVSHDPSDLGGDAKGLVYRHGVVVLEAKDIETGDVNEGCDQATQYALDIKADWFVWDGDGLGVSLRRQVSQSLPKMDLLMFKGSEEPDNPTRIYEPLEGDPHNRKANKDTFRNKRAQYYWNLRDRFYKTYLAVNKRESFDSEELISISSGISNLTKLRSEVCRVPLIDNLSGRIQIMNKAQMRTKHKIASPNIGDALMMSLAPKPNRKRRASPQPQIKVL
jgi:phage terminase large subunit